MTINLFKPNDWIIIYKGSGEYSTYESRIYNLPNKKWYCYLEYSKSRNKYKISNSLDYYYDWVKESSPYQKCLDKQIELQKTTFII